MSDVNYTLIDSRCLHPFLGCGSLLFNKETEKYAFLISKLGNGSYFWYFDQSYEYVIIENIETFLKDFVLLKEDGEDFAYLSPMGCDELCYPIFGGHSDSSFENDIIMFRGNNRTTYYVRFDGILQKPFQEEGTYEAPTGQVAEEWFCGAEYLRGTFDFTELLVDSGRTSFSLNNYRDPTTDFKNKNYEIVFDTSGISAWGRISTSVGDDFCGEYVGIGTNSGKQFRLGYGHWIGDKKDFFESLKTDKDGGILIDGLTLEDDEFIYGKKGSPEGYWKTEKNLVKLGDPIILNYVKPNEDAEEKADITLEWQGYTYYDNKTIRDDNGTITSAVYVPLHTEKINVMETPVWR